ncbi:MAG: pitrilysin family protein [bacterium]|nr:pitrilysin family protein [bacterium]
MRYSLSTLPNHLRLLTVPVSGIDSVTILVLVKTGSRYEKNLENGIAHFTEHMFFKGTEKRPTALDITKEIDAVGGVMNAFTAEEYTGYYTKVASKEFNRGVDVLSDMLLHSTFEAAEIEREAGVIIEEINMVEDIPQRKVVDVFKQLVYGDTPLGRPVGGVKKTVREMQREDFLAYCASLYTPENALVVVSGNIPKTAVSSLQTAFGSWTGKRDRHALNQNDTQARPVLKVLRRPGEQAHLVLGFRSIRREDPRRFPLAILNTIMGGNMSSRLFLEIREKRGLAYAISSSQEPFTDVGVWAVYAGVDLKKLVECVTVMLSECARMRDAGPTEEELHRAKEYLKGRLTLRLEDSEEVASFFGMQALLDKTIETPDEIMHEIDMVRHQDIQKVSAMMIQPERLNVAMVGPVSKGQEKEIWTKLSSF